MGKNELEKKAPEFKTVLIKYQERYLKMISDQLENSRITMDSYRNTCIMNAVTAIQSLSDAKGTSLSDPKMDQTSVSQCLIAVALLKLNASASPREIYFIVRNAKKGDEWIKKIEMGIEGDGNDSILRRFGVNIKTVHPYWVVYEGDDFTPPKYDGINVTPPQWTPQGKSSVPYAVVYPITLNDGTTHYHLSYREATRSNLLAHISNNMQNETFGVCVDRYKASDLQKKQIVKKRNELMAIAEGLSLNDILNNEDLAPWISSTYKDGSSRELMLIRKMRNNITKKIPKDFESDSAVLAYNDLIEEEPETKDIGGDEEEPELIEMDIPEPQKITKPPKTHPTVAAEEPELDGQIGF